MTQQKPKPKKAAESCKHKGKVSILIILLIILALLVLFLPSSHEKATVDNVPVIEMISDSIEVGFPTDTPEEIATEEIPPEINIEIEDKTPIDPLFQLGVEGNLKIVKNRKDPIQLVETFFDSYNDEDFETACDIIVDTKCDATSYGSVSRLGEEFEKLDGGYQNLVLRKVDAPDFHSDVVCVEYDYRYSNSSNPDLIHEIMSFYVLDDKITYRICEEKSRGDEKLECPIASRRDFCL